MDLRPLLGLFCIYFSVIIVQTCNNPFCTCYVKLQHVSGFLFQFLHSPSLLEITIILEQGGGKYLEAQAEAKLG